MRSIAPAEPAPARGAAGRRAADRRRHAAWTGSGGAPPTPGRPHRAVRGDRRPRRTRGLPEPQRFRWGAENVADTPAEALSRLLVPPGSHHSDPDFGWRHVLRSRGDRLREAPAAGPRHFGDLFVGVSTTDTFGGPLFHFDLTGNRGKLAADDPHPEDRVADKLTFHDITESESPLDRQRLRDRHRRRDGPEATPFVVSLWNGAIYEIRRSRA